ncbi:MAG: GNAT family N-acetyltransferase [Acidobacteriaceae bacterium]|nr:GNAT family N-acetyltransferase [Acidobacteriaceae bacterium]
MAVSFTLRPAQSADEDFLYRLYEATHGQQFSLLPLSPEHREALVRMQFQAQRTGYRQQYPASQDSIIEVNRESAGRVWLDDVSKSELHLVDIAILPGQQGRGLGAAVLQWILESAEASKKAVSLYVARMNVRAIEFYRRLGFREIGGDEVYIEMRAGAIYPGDPR